MKRFARRFAAALLPTAAFAQLARTLHGHPRTGVDDAEILLVYARHLALGHGFVYNVGGERVDGFTALLWVLLCAPFTALWDAPELPLVALCVGLAACSYALLGATIERLFVGIVPPGRSPWLSAAFLVLVLASPAHVTWVSITLMGAGLWGLLLAAAAVLLVGGEPRDARRTSGLLAALIPLLVLARPEAILLAPVLIALHASERWLAGGARALRRAILVPGAAYAGAVGALTAFRLAYFGFPLPNTWYAKVSPSLAYNLAEGLGYLAGYVASSPLVAIAVFLAVLVPALRIAGLLARANSPQDARARLERMLGPSSRVALLCVALLALPVLSGGDHFAWFRFYQPVYPLLLLSLFCFLRDAVAWLGPRRDALLRASRVEWTVAAAVAVALLFAGAQADGGWWGLRSRKPIAHEFRIAERGRMTGEQFRLGFAARERLPSLGVVVAGGIKRSYPGEVVDLMGLNCVRMGHSPGERIGVKNHAAFDKAVFYELLPDVVVPSVETLRPAPGDLRARGVLAGLHGRALQRIDRDRRFRALYTFASVHPVQEPRVGWLSGFFRTELLAELRGGGRYEVVVASGAATR